MLYFLHFIFPVSQFLNAAQYPQDCLVRVALRVRSCSLSVRSLVRSDLIGVAIRGLVLRNQVLNMMLNLLL